MRWHPDEPGPTRKKAVDREFRVIRNVREGRLAVPWLCPLCKHGIPEGGLARVSRLRVKSAESAKDKHREARHAGVDVTRYGQLCRAQGAKQAVVVNRKRVDRLNRARASRFRTDGPGKCVPLTWPRLKKGFKLKGSSEKPMKFRLSSAWRCPDCPRVFADEPYARKHRCQRILKRFLQTRVKQLDKYVHGLAPEVLEGLCKRARHMIGGKAVADLAA